MRRRGRSHAPSDLLIQDERHPLTLLESTDQGGDGIYNADGTVNMVLIRPCNGRGPGRRIYEATMLERDAGIFAGLSMFDNHDSPQAKRARGHLPRPTQDLRGHIAESFWDPDFVAAKDAERGFDQGAVIGRCRLTPQMRSLVESIPESVRTSLNMMATGLTPGRRNGQDGMLVEGITTYDDDSSSVDLVTVDGAGGQVAALLEAFVDDPDRQPTRRREPAPDDDDVTLEEAFDAASDDEILAALQESRPHLIDQLVDEHAQGGEMDLREALQSDEVQDLIGRQVKAGIEAALRGDVGRSLQEAAVAQIAGPARMRVLRDKAKALIEAAKLPRSTTANLLADYGLAEHADGRVTPARALALIEAQMDGDRVVRTDEQVLADAIDADVRARRNELAEAAPTTPWTPLTGDDKGELSETAAAVNVAAAGRSLSSFGLDPARFGIGSPVAAGKEA